MTKKDQITRRQFLKDSGIVVGAGAAAAGVLSSFKPTPAEAAPIPKKWDQEADVIVAGSGPMGLSSATAAVDKGASVIVLEQGKEVGGCGVISGGLFNLGGGTRIQKLNNVSDSPQLMFERLTHYTLPDSRKNDPALVRAFCDANPGILDWLEQHGVRFMENLSPASGLDSLHMMQFHYLLTDKEGPGLAWLKTPEGVAQGSGLMKPLESYTRNKGVKILVEHKMTRIIRKGGTTGRVLGVEVQAGKKRLYFRARKGAILGTGLWKGNRVFRKLWDPRFTEDLPATGEPFVNSDGSGTLAALEAGALLVGHRSSDSNLFRRKFGTKHYNFPLNSPYGAPGLIIAGPRMADVIFVNKAGMRFVNEQDVASFGEYSHFDASLAQEGHVQWTIFDDTAAKKYKWDINPPVTEKGCAFAAPTLPELAKLIDVPGDALAETVRKFNTYVDAGKDPDFGKPQNLLKSKIETSPFYAVWITLLVHDTSQCGGILVNAKTEVLDSYGKVIPGLYAGGDVSAGFFYAGTVRGVIMGRFAGENAAAEKPA